MNTPQIHSCSSFLPMVYAYTTPGVTYSDGFIKIGYTDRQTVDERIKQQTHTTNIKIKKEWTGMAIYEDGSGCFTDKDFHGYLGKLGIERIHGHEWFKIGPKESHTHFIEFKCNHGIIGSQEDESSVSAYTPRHEQEEAVSRTQAYFNSHKKDKEKPEFLWNAKPRFGKTLTAYELCKRIDAKFVLIVTNRPAIANSWYDDYEKFIGPDKYWFVSDVSSLKGKKPKYLLSPDKYIENKNGEPCIVFVSLQNLKGGIDFGGKYDKLEQLAEKKWDLLIVDEAHEGVDTSKTDIAFSQIERSFTLHLSGTPFKALAADKFPEEAVYNWSYADEQKTKADWDKEHPGEANPYAGLPRLNMFTYRMSDIAISTLKQGADFDNDGQNEQYCFDLNEFFKVRPSGIFEHAEAVDKFLDALTCQEKFPFSTPQLRDELKHTFWLLDRVASARALAKKLKEHPAFKDYEIVVAAGKGESDEDDLSDEACRKSLDKVRKAIKSGRKTITLSVGQLTTGVTVPEWTAVLMLSNAKSPALYMQAAFRAQNPWEYTVKADDCTVLHMRKENAYVFDFDPARTLDIIEKFANDLIPAAAGGRADLSDSRSNICELLNFFPVYGEDEEGAMIELDAEKVMSIPRRIHAKEVVRRGFMCNFLFQNISRIFGAPKQIGDILTAFSTEEEGELIVPKQGDIFGDNEEPPQELIDKRIGELFGPEIYSRSQEDFVSEADEAMSRAEKDRDKISAAAKIFGCEVIQRLSGTAEREMYNDGTQLPKAVQKRAVKEIRETADKKAEELEAGRKIRENKLDRERNDRLKEADTEEERQKIYADCDRKLAESDRQFEADKNKAIEELYAKARKITAKEVIEDENSKNKKTVEDRVRAHLRGFSRTIPSFLMAYGTEETALENFDKIVPPEVFQEVTGITLEEFCLLRDGGECMNEHGQLDLFEGRLFDPVVFNDAVKEFLALKKRLGCYFIEDREDDIFDYIPPQENNQIFTPKPVVKKMADMLEKENPGCFDNPDATFLDPYMKSGMFIAEIVKRLFRSERLKKQFPDESVRLSHIFEKQVYGLAPTEIIYRIACSYVLGFEGGSALAHNLRKCDTLPLVKEGRLQEKLDELYS